PGRRDGAVDAVADLLELEQILVRRLGVGGHGTAKLVGIEGVHRCGCETHLGENLPTRPWRHHDLLVMGGLEGPPKPPALASAPAKPWRCSITLIRPEDQVGLEVGDFGAAAEAHRDVHLIAQDLEDPSDTLGAVGAETPERRAAQHDDPGAAGPALDHVGALRDSAA